MNVILVGATGLLGHNVLITLLREGHNVITPVRNPLGICLPADLQNHPNLHPVPFSFIASPHQTADAIGVGALIDSDTAVINCAGTTNMALLHYDDYLPMNRDLVVQLLRLMDAFKLRTLVHVSTANTIGFGTPDSPATESCPMCPPFADSFYARSKREGEKLLEQAASQRPDSHIVILNPGFMVGAYDTHPSSGKLLLAGYRRRLMVSPSGGKSFVHVTDVARAAVNALTMGVSGQRYLLTGYDMSLKEFYSLQARECGYRKRCVVLPDWLLAIAGRVGDLLRLCGIRTQLSTRNVRQLMVMEYYSDSLAVRDLKIGHTPLGTAIHDFFDWYNAQKQK